MQNSISDLKARPGPIEWTLMSTQLARISQRVATDRIRDQAMRLHAVKKSAILGLATLTLIATIVPGDAVVGVRQDPQVNLERALEIIGSMEDAWETITDYTAIVDKTERFRDGNVRSEQALVKYRKPA